MVSTVIWGSFRVIEASLGLHVPSLSGEPRHKDMHVCKMLIGSCMQHGMLQFSHLLYNLHFMGAQLNQPKVGLGVEMEENGPNNL